MVGGCDLDPNDDAAQDCADLGPRGGVQSLDFQGVDQAAAVATGPSMRYPRPPPTDKQGPSRGEFMTAPDKRQHARRTISLTGAIRAGDGDGAPSVACEIQDLSVGGARVILAATLNLPKTATIEIAQFGSYAVEVIWIDHQACGLRFKEDPEKMADVITAIALHA